MPSRLPVVPAGVGDIDDYAFLGSSTAFGSRATSTTSSSCNSSSLSSLSAATKSAFLTQELANKCVEVVGGTPIYVHSLAELGEVGFESGHAYGKLAGKAAFRSKTNGDTNQTKGDDNDDHGGKRVKAFHQRSSGDDDSDEGGDDQGESTSDILEQLRREKEPNKKCRVDGPTSSSSGRQLHYAPLPSNRGENDGY
eukprot:scaffold41494_cov50-Attheya_sp.AAC.1